MIDSNKIDVGKFYEMNDGKVQLSYKGPLEKFILSFITRYIENLKVRNRLINKRLMSVFIELAQNIANFSAEVYKNSDDDEAVIHIASILINETSENYTFFIGNAVNKKDISELLEKCDFINSLDREKLRKYKREKRILPIEDDGFKEVSLIQIALISGNPLNIKINPINDDYSFFSMQVIVNK